MIDKLGLDGLGGASVKKPKVVNKLTALVEAAKTSMNTTHPDEVAWYASDTLVNKGVAYVEDSNFITLANPTTILELCALLEKAEEAMEKFHACFDMLTDGPDDSDKALAMQWLEQGRDLRSEYLAAIKQWKE